MNLEELTTHERLSQKAKDEAEKAHDEDYYNQ
jgi:hypothetical protein